eukprot:GHVR01155710.1.p1 GENE.GHVR01155710.1~~GHVR01155710.1.p1  ORF type:complete len:242 (+),score=58.78 GHVR01155710.1:54-779(+)
MEDAIGALSDLDVGDSVLVEALSLIRKLFANIVREPSNEKYRRIKTSNTVLRDKLLSCDPPDGMRIRHVFIVAGFTESEGDLIFPLNVEVDMLNHFIEHLDAVIMSLPERGEASPSASSSQPNAAPIPPVSVQPDACSKRMPSKPMKESTHEVQKAALDDIRAMHKEKYNSQSNQHQPSTSNAAGSASGSGGGGSSGGGGFFSNWFGSSGSSRRGGGSSAQPKRTNIRGFRDLPKPPAKAG